MPINLPGTTGDASTQPKVLSLTGFLGLNTNDTRPGIKDQEMSWVLNFIPIGQGNLRTMYGIGPTDYGINGKPAYLPGAVTNYPLNYCNYFTMQDGAPTNSLDLTAPAPTPDEWMFAAGPSSAPFQLYNITKQKLFIGYPPYGSAAGSVRVQAAAWNNESLLVVDGSRLLVCLPFTYPPNDPSTPNKTIVSFLGPGSIAPVLTLAAAGANYGLATDQPIGATITGGSGYGVEIYPYADGEGRVVGMGIIDGGQDYSVIDSPLTVTFTDNPNGQVTATATLTSAAVSSVSVSNGGTYWTKPPAVTFTGGGGTGAAAYSVLTATSVKRLDIVQAGWAFDFPPTVIVAGGGGSGCLGTCTLTPAGVTGVELITEGGGYTTPPSVTFAGGGGTGAAAFAVLTGGAVSAIVVTDPGTGYTNQPDVLITGGGGNGASAYASLNTTVASVTVTAGGSGYTSSPYAYAAVEGGGYIRLTISSGVITAATIDAFAKGLYYSTPTVNIVDPYGTGSGASISVLLSSVSLDVDAFYVTAGGQGYPANTTTSVALTISGGGGSGATGFAIINGDGEVVGVNLTSGGSGYTSPPNVAVATPAGSGGAEIICFPRYPLLSAIVISGGANYSASSYAYAGGFTLLGKQGKAKFSAALTDTSVASITVTNGGSGYTSAPAVVVGGSGANGTIALMPFGAGGTCIEIYQERVWIGNGTTLLFSAGGNPYDFNTPDGAGAFAINETYLKRQIVALKQVNGFLYVFGDSSIFVVSNIQTVTSGTTVTTTLSVYNIDAQVGTPWRDTVQQYGYGIIFTNPDGVYAITGGASQKISVPLNGLFANLVEVATDDPAAYSAAVATIFGIRCYFVVINTLDYLRNPINVMCAYNGRGDEGWFLANQCYNPNYYTLLSSSNAGNLTELGQPIPMTFINTKEVNTEISVIGTDGTVLFDLFNKPDSVLTKVVQTKLWAGDNILAYKQSMRIWGVFSPQVYIAGVTFDIDTETAYSVASAALGVSNLPVTIAGTNVSAFGLLLGMTCSTTIPDTTVVGLLLHYKDITVYA